MSPAQQQQPQDEVLILRDDVLDPRTAERLHVDNAQLHALKHSKDGHILVPQPNDDPNNPLNFREGKKWAILLAVSFASILPDYGSATGAVTLIPQGLDWNLDANYVNHSQAGNVFMLGAGGIVAVIFSQAYGRLPTLFWMIGLSVVFAVLNAAAPSYDSFFASRILNGFFSAPAQATGILIIQDLFFFHNQVRRTNVWSAAFILSPYIGPVISAAVLSADSTNVKLWHWSFGQFAILSGLAFIGICLFADETWYNRRVAEANQPSVGSRLVRLTGIGRPKGSSTRYSLKEATLRMFKAITRLPLLLTCLSFSLSFAMVVGINTTLPLFLVPLYGFGNKQIALFYLTPVTAVILGELSGHWLNYWIQEAYLKRSHGQWKAEARLWMNCIALPFMISGLVLLGFALERKWHFMLISLGWGLFVYSIMLVCTSYYQYCVDVYPNAGGEVSAWINMFRVLGGFVISYEIVNYVESKGAIHAFGSFAGMAAVSFCFIPVLMLFGPKLRSISGPIGYEVPAVTGRFEGKETPESTSTVAAGPDGEKAEVDHL